MRAASDNFPFLRLSLFVSALLCSSCEAPGPRVVIRIPYVMQEADTVQVMTLRGTIGAEQAAPELLSYPIPIERNGAELSLGVHLPEGTDGRVIFGVAAVSQARQCLLATGDATLDVSAVANAEKAAEITLGLFPIDPEACDGALRVPRLLPVRSDALLVTAGDTATIAGWGLRPDDLVTMQGQPAPLVAWQSPRQLQVQVPWLPNVVGSLDTAIAAPGSGAGGDTRADLFSYRHTLRLQPTDIPYRTDGATALPIHAVTADLDGRNGPDLAILWSSIQDSQVWLSVLLNNGQSGFQDAKNLALSEPFASRLVPVELDGKAGIDLALAAGGASAHISPLLNDGTGNFTVQGATSPIATDALSSIDQLSAADLNMDGIFDLLVLYRGGSFSSSDTPHIYYLLGRGSSSFDTAVEFTLSKRPAAFVCADLDGKAGPDLAITFESASNSPALGTEVYLSMGGTSFAAPDSYYLLSGSIIAQDVDGDGFLDLVARDGRLLNQAPGQGPGKFAVGSKTAGGTASLLAIGNMNGDPASDLVYNTGYLLSLGAPALNPDGFLSLPPRVFSVFDSNGDGLLDLFSASTQPNRLTFHRNVSLTRP